MKLLFASAFFLVAFPALGQETTEESAENSVLTVAQRLVRMIELPSTVQESRDLGIAETVVRGILNTARELEIPADEMDEILKAENTAVRSGASVDNFGAAVQEMKASGLRGRELANAIHAEQVARGMKKPKKERPAKGNQRPDDAGSKKNRGGGR